MYKQTKLLLVFVYRIHPTFVRKGDAKKLKYEQKTQVHAGPFHYHQTKKSAISKIITYDRTAVGTIVYLFLIFNITRLMSLKNIIVIVSSTDFER